MPCQITTTDIAASLSFSLILHLHASESQPSATNSLTIHKEESNKMQKYIKILLFYIHIKLNMFRTPHRPSSGA